MVSTTAPRRATTLDDTFTYDWKHLTTGASGTKTVPLRDTIGGEGQRYYRDTDELIAHWNRMCPSVWQYVAHETILLHWVN